MFKKRKLFLAIVFLFLFISPNQAESSAEFETSYNVIYRISQDGKVTVIQNISLTNKLSNVYATQYSLTLHGGKIKNLKASDEKGNLRTEVSQREDSTSINLFFNQETVGTGKVLKFNLTYDALDIASKNGQIWEISIPKISPNSQIDNYFLTLETPESFGNPAFIKPTPYETANKDGFNQYKFTKEQISVRGINAAFGQFQIFDFKFGYHLENTGTRVIETEIALPPDTAFQKISFKDIEPKPLNIRIDNNGNWLASYKLKPKEKIKIVALGRAKIFAEPLKDFPAPSQNNLEKNLLPQRYWEVDNPLIVSKANELKTTKNIYLYVIKTLSYDFNKVREKSSRLGALVALNNPEKSICMEFTDLFIALTRAANIPAREINGFAYTTNVKIQPSAAGIDVLHSWPEYYDEQKKIWLPVDPTWEKTTEGVDYFSKNDLNHFVFAIHGENSEFPLPAGSFEVTFGSYEKEEESVYEVKFFLPKKIIWGKTYKGKIIVRNLGPVSGTNLKISVKTQGVTLQPDKINDTILTIIPPFGSVEFEANLKSTGFLTTNEGKIIVEVKNKQFMHLMKNNFLFWLILFLGVVFILIMTLVIILTKKRIYHKIKKE